MIRHTTAIFEPFFTTKALARHRTWLATVYGIVQQSGGISACRASRQRSTFTFFCRS